MGCETLTKPLMGLGAGVRRGGYRCLPVIIPEEGRLVRSGSRGRRCSSVSPKHRQLAHSKPSASRRSGCPGLEEGRPFSAQDTRGPPTCQSAVTEEALAKSHRWPLSTRTCAREPRHLLLKCQALAAPAKHGTCICPQESSCLDAEGWMQWDTAARGAGGMRAPRPSRLRLAPRSPPSCPLSLCRSLVPRSAL